MAVARPSGGESSGRTGAEGAISTCTAARGRTGAQGGEAEEGEGAPASGERPRQGSQARGHFLYWFLIPCVFSYWTIPRYILIRTY